MFTFGWLVDQLIRRTDPQCRSVSQFIQEELVDPLGVDFFFELPETKFFRKAYAYESEPIEDPADWPCLVRGHACG